MARDGVCRSEFCRRFSGRRLDEINLRFNQLETPVPNVNSDDYKRVEAQVLEAQVDEISEEITEMILPEAGVGIDRQRIRQISLQLSRVSQALLEISLAESEVDSVNVRNDIKAKVNELGCKIFMDC